MLSITKSLLLASLAVVAIAAPVQLQARAGSSTVIEDNSQHNGQGSGGLLGLGVNLLNNLNLGGATTGSNNQGNGNGAVSFSKANGFKSGSGSKGNSLVYEDNSQSNGQGSGGLLGLGLNALNNANILGFVSGSNNQGNGNGATTIHARDSVTVENNSQNNGQAAGLIAVGANVANGDTILGYTSGSNNQGNNNGAFAANLASTKSKGSSQGNSFTYENNSQNNGQAAGGVAAIGLNALNGDTILGAASGSNNQGNGNGSTRFNKAKRA